MIVQPTVVLAHHDRPTRTLFAQQLCAAGYGVVEAATGDECLQHVHTIRPAVALIAQALPDLDGRSVCQALRASSNTSHTLCVLIATTPPCEQDALDSLVDAWLVTPHDETQLLSIIRLLLRTHGAEQQNVVYESTVLSYHDVIRTALDGFWVIRYHDARFLTVNEAYCAMIGYSRDELLTMSISDIEASEDATAIAERSARLVKQGAERFETSHRHKNGSIINVELSVRYIERPDALMVAFVRDITARKQAEITQKRTTQELARKNRELEQIVYVASHDLRSPLVNMQGFSRELAVSLEELRSAIKTVDIPTAQRSQVAFLVDHDIPESLEYILISASKMDTLLKGLLRLSRLGRAALNIVALDVNRIIAETLATFDFQIKQSKATVTVAPLPHCLGDAVQVGQIFDNLVSNALKYRDGTRPLALTITGDVVHGMAVYRVADTGIGIAVEHQEKIFELYHRLNPLQSEGEGLGLMIVRTIVDRQSGWVHVTSTPGVGSEFHIGLPEAPQ